jgi:hypothetical protein
MKLFKTPLADRLNAILTEEKKELVNVILTHRRNTQPNFNENEEFNLVCELWTWSNTDLHAEVNDILGDQWAELQHINQLKG